MGGCADCLAGGLVAFIFTLVVTGKWISMLWRSLERLEGPVRRAFQSLHFGKDMNKPGDVYAPRFAGIWSVLGVLFGFLVMEAYHVYLGGGPYRVQDVLSVSLLLLLGAFVGLVDDIMGWKVGVPVRYRLLASYAIALPLSVVKAGTSVISVPLLGRVDLGAAYSLVVIPAGVMGASNAFNMLAGFNGLEAGMATIILAGYAAYALLHGKVLALKLSIVAIAGLIAFLVYNWYPAKVFPGNSFTYAFGSLLAAIVIVDNFEKFGVALFALYFLELALFLRGLKDGIYKETFGLPRPDGSLDLRYPKVYSVTHLAIKVLKKIRGRATERGVTLLVLSWQAIITLIVLAVMG